MKKTKNKNHKKDFKKFTGRNTHKRRSKDEARRALLRAVESTGVGYSQNIKIGYTGGAKKGEKRIQGVFLGSSSGYGFVRSEEYHEDIFIPAGNVGAAIDGDLVEASFRETGSYNGRRTEGRVCRIVEYGRRSIVGTVVCSARGMKHPPVLVPDDARLSIRPYITELSGAEISDKVLATLTRAGGGRLFASVVEVYGPARDMGANYKAILDEFEIETEFSDEELYEAERAASQPVSEDGRVRRDDEIIFTIDGEGAKDLDDAVSIKRTRGGYLVGVHIADVSSYVKERCALDRAVMRRGTSIYFTDKVVPMLPPALSNGACSLNPGEEKLALSAIISVSDSGDIRSLKLEKSIIVSRVRGVYSEVNAIFEGNATTQILEKYKEVIPSLEKMRALYRILLEKGKRRGAIDLDIPEAEILLDEGGEPTDIVKRTRGDAERLIEQLMLLANEAVAEELYSRGVPCVYRIHERPEGEKLSDFIEYAEGLGLRTHEISKENAPSAAFQSLLRLAEEEGLLTQVSRAMLRAMAKAKYSDVKQLHFGLGIESYCHFTSPIRRLSDLATHRIIHKVIFDGGEAKKYSSYAKRAAAAATEGELRALSCERKIEGLYKTVYFLGKIGEEFYATVSSVTSYGMFCELDNTCEGLVSIHSIGGYFDEKSRLIRTPGGTFAIGDRVRIRVENADIIHTRVDFSLVLED